MMHPVHQPLRFEPFFRPMIWGSRRIARYLGKNLPGPGPFGESWEVSDHPVHFSQLATASLHGVTLRQLMEQDRQELLGSAAPRHTVFPWLIKLLDANDWLSVQVHPDEEAARKVCPGESAKTEAWYVLDAAATGRIYAGLKAGVGPRELRRALAAGTVTECLHGFTPQAGDLLYLPAGTVHAVGGGVFMAEIQQTSDATFRLFDWNRRDARGQPRPLHIEESFQCIHWDQGPIAPISTKAAIARTRLVTCPYFEIELLSEAKEVSLGGQHRLQTLIVTGGCGRFANGEFVLPGDAWVFPAAMPQMMFHPEQALTGLLYTLP